MGPSGCSLGEYEGKTIQVRSAPPGATVHVAPFKVKQGVMHARRVTLVEPPPNLQTPPCSIFGLCGGCAFQEISLDAQRHAKHERVLQLVPPGPNTQVLPVAGAPAAYGYRNKVELSFGVRCYLTEADNDAGKTIHGTFLGFHAPGRFDRVVDAERCELADPNMNAALAGVRKWWAENPLAPWDVREHTGFLKHLVLRASTLGQVLIAVYTGEPTTPEQQTAMESLAGFVNADALLWYVNPRVADAAIGDLRQVLAGKTTIDEALGDVRYQLSATAFFQTNTPGAVVLYDLIGQALGSGERLLDLYCGTGAIGLYLGDRYDKVLGIEMNPDAVDDAVQNATRNGRAQVRYIAGKVEDNLPTLQPGDVAVVDPPRAGLHPKVAKFLAKSALTRLVYVACKPESLARDRLVFEENGWELELLQTVDLFPQTGHIEVIARFVRPRPALTDVASSPVV
jgi:23S rRNA (uracil1939-C5)-methyltransferase